MGNLSKSQTNKSQNKVEMRSSCFLAGFLFWLSLSAAIEARWSEPGLHLSAQPANSGGGISDIITKQLFEEMLKHRNEMPCPSKGFYTYDAFISAAKAFPEFGNTGDNNTRKREIAAFFAQTSHETGGGWPFAPDGIFAWGYCYVSKTNPFVSPWWAITYCAPNFAYPCTPFKQYYGRGPFQLTWNFNYGQCGKAIGVDLLGNPDLVAMDPVISFKSALWFWMTPQAPTPSSHSVITGQYSPSVSDSSAGRVSGFGLTTNIINGGVECGAGIMNPMGENRIGFYKRYCDLLGVAYGDHVDCYNQKPFGFFNGYEKM